MSVHQDTLHVIAVISNPVRFKSRYYLYRKFREHMRLFPNIKLHTCEVAFGERPFVVTRSDDPRHLRLRTDDEIWHKENMINLCVQRLPANWKYVAWVDADIMFQRKDWALETIQQLQHYHVVQLFQNAIDLGPTGEVIQHHAGFCYKYLSGAPRGPKYEFWHPGFAWACTRYAWEKLGGLIDFAVLGAADHHMALALIGKANQSVPLGISKNYIQEIKVWEARAEKYIKRDIGFVPGTILHNWHGKKKDRKYVERWDILTKHNFDPDLHLKRDWQGLFQLEDDQLGLRDDIRAYFRQRSEDSIDKD